MPHFSKLLFMSVALSFSAFAQVSSLMQCAVTAGVPPLVRADGHAERVGDLLLTCTGGAQQQPSLATFQLFLNTNLTSRLVTADLTEALLLIDEPGSSQNARFCPSPSPSQNSTGGAGSLQTVGSAGSGCTLTPVGPTNPLPATGQSLQTGTYNAFQAERGRSQQTGAVVENSVMWTNVPIVPPAGAGSRIIRITNVRAEATTIGPGSLGLPGQVVAFISIAPPGVLPINNPQQTLAFVQPGLKAELRTPADTPYTPITLPAGGLNAGLLANNGAAATPQYLVRFTEGYPTAFMPRSTAPAGDPVPPQSVPGALFYDETGFYAQISARRPNGR